MKQPSQKPQQSEELDHQPLEVDIREHWRKYLPRKYRALKESGDLDRAISEAAHLTGDALYELLKEGVPYNQAWEAVREEWAFPLEDDPPEETSPSMAELLETSPEAAPRGVSEATHAGRVNGCDPPTVVTREEATRGAGDYLAQHPALGARVRGALRWEEILWRRPLADGIRPEALAESWICYVVGPDEGIALRSSTIIVVSEDTGEVLYAGSANDEGSAPHRSLIETRGAGGHFEPSAWTFELGDAAPDVAPFA